MAALVKRTKKPRSDLKKAHEKCWVAFSKYIRTRDCIRFRNSLDEGICITCKREYPFKQLQAGHFIGGRTNVVLYDERIVYSQCSSCNVNPPYGLGGNYVEYFVFMEKEWGREKIDEFRLLKHQTVKYTPFELLALRDSFAERTRELKENYRSQQLINA